jgi:PKD repeat protein
MKKQLQFFRKTIIIGIFTCLSLITYGKTIYVSTDGLGDGSSSTNRAPFDQAIISNTSKGDVILLADGTYYLTGTITIGKSITVKSENGWQNCIIDAAFIEIAFDLLASNVSIIGLHIQNVNYIGINCMSALIEGCKFENIENALVFEASSTPTIRKNIFEFIFNHAIYFKLSSTSFSIYNNTFLGESGFKSPVGIRLPSLGDSNGWNIYNNIFNYFDTAIIAKSGFIPGTCIFNFFSNNSLNTFNFTPNINNITDKADPLIDPITYAPLANSPCFNTGYSIIPDGFKTYDIGAVPYVPATNNCHAAFTTLVDQENYTVQIKSNAVAEVAFTTTYYFDYQNLFEPYYGIDTFKTNPFTYQYYYTGEYKIAQIIEDKVNNCSDTLIQKIVLRDKSCYTYIDYPTVFPDKLVEFNINSYTYSDTIKSYLWDFGDGTTKTTEKISKISHVYAEFGKEYQIKVIALGSYCKDSSFTYVKPISAYCDTPRFTTQIFDATDSIICTITSPKAKTSYSWDFGDYSNYIDGSKVTHKYADDGRYEVSVWLNDSINLCSANYSEIIKVGNADLWSDFGYYELDSNKIVFENFSTLNAEYYWEFGDGFTSKEIGVEHKFRQAGIYNSCLTVKNASGIKKKCKEITVGHVDCKADFSFTIDSKGNAVFTDKSKGTSQASTWFYWDFGDWNYSYDQNGKHTYSEDGVYKVNLYIYNYVTGCSDEITKEITVGNTATICKADFTYYIENDNKTIHFEDASKNATSWYWTFGDGTFLSNAKVDKIFNKPGLYNVCLTVFNKADGSTSSKCEEIIIGQAACNIVADYTYTIDNAKNSVKFNNKSTGDFDAFYWDFNDGQTSGEANPTHVYSKAGFYLVSVAVKKKNSDCSDFYADFIQVGQTDCKADFEYLVDAANKKVTLNQKSKGNIKVYFWYFDDGSYEITKDAEHTFDLAGMHNVSLTVADESGLCYDYIEKEIQVGKIECSAQFSYYVDIPNLKAFCKNEAIGNSTNYYWVFGDGYISTDTNPSHEFEKPGYYTISLNTYDSQSGCMDYFEKPVLIGTEGSDCEADFNFQVNDSKNEVKFIDNSLGTISKYLWNFGDNTLPDNTKNPSHTFNVGGYYDICLTVVNNKGISNITCKEVLIDKNINNECQAKFSYTVDSSARKVILVDKSLGKPTKLEWNYGVDLSLDTKASPVTHTYNKNGYYLTSLHITTASGCTSSYFELINVGESEGLAVNFGFNALLKSTKSGGYPVEFVGAGVGEHARLRWTFGDSIGNQNIDTTTNSPTHEYSNPGTYKVCLTYADPITGDSVTTCNFIQTKSATNIESIKAINTFKLYPNPVSANLQIAYTLAENSKVEINVYNLLGKKVENAFTGVGLKGSQINTYNTSKLSSGSYFIEVKTNGFSKKQVFVKQ